MRIFHLLALLVLASLATGCVKRAQQTAEQQTAVCRANKFLQKYGCSLDRVEEAAANNDPDAEYALGYMYYYGIDTTQDTETGKVWIRRAAHQGHPLAVKALALLNKKQYPDMGQVVAEKKPEVKAHEGTQLKFAHHTQTQKVVSHQQPATHSAPLTVVPQGKYTVQLVGSHSRSHIKAFLQKHGIETRATYRRITRRGENWYEVLYGRFQTKAEARAALKHLPASLRQLHPWIRTY